MTMVVRRLNCWSLSKACWTTFSDLLSNAEVASSNNKMAGSLINARAMVRPAITYGLFFLFVFVEVAGFFYALRSNVEFTVVLDQLWDDETQLIWSSVVAFWFGTQAFSKK